MTALSPECADILSGDRDAVARALDLGKPGGHVSGHVYISLSTGCRKIWSCRLCGRQLASCSAKWRTTRRAYAAIEAGCSCEVTNDEVVRALRNQVAHEALQKQASDDVSVVWERLRGKVSHHVAVRRAAKRIRDRAYAQAKRQQTKENVHGPGR